MMIVKKNLKGDVNMELANQDIRNESKSKRVSLWRIALHMGISEPTMTRKLRTELPTAEKEKIFAIIDEIAAENKKEAAC